MDIKTKIQFLARSQIVPRRVASIASRQNKQSATARELEKKIDIKVVLKGKEI